MKQKILPLVLLLSLCACSNTDVEIPATIEEELFPTTEVSTEEMPFTAISEDVPDEDELSPVDPLESLDITPSDYFTPGVWTSVNTDDTGNFYIFDKDGIHGKMIPMADADGIDFIYLISGNRMTMYVGEELTPYNATLERLDDGRVIINMTFLGTRDELTFLSDISAENFTFYPAAKLTKMAEKYFTEQTGITPAGSEYSVEENDMLVINLWVLDENGWRSDIESYTVSMFTAIGWSSISLDEIDLSGIVLETPAVEEIPNDDIPDVIEITS